MPKLRLTCLSDTHNASPGGGYTLPAGDILIHAGDLTNQGSPHELQKALAWLREADFAAKVVVAGNHDLALDERNGGFDEEMRKLVREDEGLVYLEHESAVVEVKGVKVKVFGSPYSLASSGEKQWAFQTSPDAAEKLWSAVPSDTDVLITHTPPLGHLDASAHWTRGGCPALKQALGRVRPSLLVCGHCHEGRGGEVIRWSDGAEGEHDCVTEWRDPGLGNRKQSLFDLTGSRCGCALRGGRETAVVNASIMAKSHGRGAKAFNKPIVVDINIPADGEVPQED